MLYDSKCLHSERKAVDNKVLKTSCFIELARDRKIFALKEVQKAFII
jgi:hypothetical protein